MHKKQRHFQILKTVRDKLIVTVPELVKIIGASPATIRRDIVILSDAGHLKKIRGGAESLTTDLQLNLKGRSFEINEQKNYTAKKAIGNYAATLCDDGDTIIISGGSTLYQMVRSLKEKKLTVLTNSLPNMQFLLENTESTVMMPGGVLYREQNIMLSPFEDNITKSFYAKQCFISALSAGPSGPMEADELIINSVGRMLSQAQSLVLLLDSSKFKSHGSLIVCPWDKIDMVITDTGLSEDKRKWIEDLGIELVIVPSHSEENNTW